MNLKDRQRQIIFSSALEPIDKRDFEVVERKGYGHPDSLADGLAEAISNEYSHYCLKRFGAILHHNLDKVAIIGGLVDIGFGQGKMLKPAKIILNGRMSDSFAGKKIDIKAFQKNVVKKYLKNVLPHLNVGKWIEINYLTNSYSHNPHWYHPRSLSDVPDHKNPHANDTSTCVDYWPLSITENLVLQLERFFYTSKGKPKFNFIGQDIKFMAVRNKKEIVVTTCIPFISPQTPDFSFYQENLKMITNELTNRAKGLISRDYQIKINTNTADNPGDYYLLLTGSCIEAGEEGVVGRGNRSRGTISSTRPFSMEAANGKNPVYHVGKVFTVLADSLAQTISKASNCECNVFVSTKNKDNLFSPYRILVETNKRVNKNKTRQIIKKHLEFEGWTKNIINKGLLLPRPGAGNQFVI